MSDKLKCALRWAAFWSIDLFYRWLPLVYVLKGFSPPPFYLSALRHRQTDRLGAAKSEKTKLGPKQVFRLLP